MVIEIPFSKPTAKYTLPFTSMRELPWADVPIVRDTKPKVFEPFNPSIATSGQPSLETIPYILRFATRDWAALDDYGNPIFYLHDIDRSKMYAPLVDDPNRALPTLAHQVLLAEAPLDFWQSVSNNNILHAEPGDVLIRSMCVSKDRIWEYFYQVAPAERINDFEHAPELADDFKRVGEKASWIVSTDKQGRWPDQKYDFKRERPIER